ncbi:hypothetical protein HAZT_HAZT005053 [Hyalella azteca]|uniref:Phosphoglycolate phosphatase n=1 Tax=Hyalella azteca TaxID=294128 RepID=A0A6A0GPA3_HYAAZ|nr:hypothetical protein HAZT_HAZT005053 [Hyalella azteca]
MRVLWSGDTVLNNANIVINKLISLGKQVFLLTNNSTKSRDDYVEKCVKLGFNVTKENIVSSAYVLALHLQQLGFEKKVYMMGTTGLAKELDAVDPLFGKTFEMIDLVVLDPEVAAVVVAFDPYFCLPKILRAASYVKSVPGCLFLASNTDESFPFKGSNLTYPGTGCFVRSVECAVGHAAQVMGKPEPHMFEVLRKRHHIKPQRTIMVGDRCNTDILLGTKCGLHTLLVLTGVHKLDDVQKMVDDPSLNDQVPQYYLPSLGDLLEFLK